MTIWDLERRILNDQPLTAEQTRVVEEALHSKDVAEQLLACETWLRLGDDRQSKDAQRVLSRIVEDANSGRVKLTANLIMVFFNLSGLALSQPTFRTALTRGASHADESVRVNCMVALANALRDGRDWAEDLLKLGLQDSSEEVRQNARAGLTLKA